MLSEHRANGRVKAGTEGGGVEDEILTIGPHCHSYGACLVNLLCLVRWGARRVVECQVTGRRPLSCPGRSLVIQTDTPPGGRGGCLTDSLSPEIGS